MNAERNPGCHRPLLLRELLLSALPEDTSPHGGQVDPRFVYLPSSHVKALRPDSMVVVGMRGAGKSFWWSALQNRQIQTLLARLDPRTEWKEQTRITPGFGERPDLAAYPDRDTLGRLLETGKNPRLIWRTVVVHALAPERHPIRTVGGWEKRVAWVAQDPEGVGHLLEKRDREFEQQKTWFLVLFDALDRTASDWRDMYRLIRGLLETVLDLRPYRRLRAKCFLRTDQLDENRVADFPDASKVLSSRAELTWTRSDLYGLLWQYLANAPHQASGYFRDMSRKEYGLRWSDLRFDQLTIWRAYTDTPDLDKVQRALFHALTGEWMGQDHRRGFPYTWIPSHLADANGRTSPRSFLAALRAAAEDTQKRYGNYERVLHYESIKRGVQTASRIRVTELKEDYPWVDLLMEPLKGLVVPCAFSDVTDRWDKAHALVKIQKRVQLGEERLPPIRLEEGYEGVRKDLEELGIFTRMSDGRVNVPDVFRVGYGLGRKGGVKPIGRGEEG
jgi:hypothetical protein